MDYEDAWNLASVQLINASEVCGNNYLKSNSERYVSLRRKIFNNLFFTLCIYFLVSFIIFSTPGSLPRDPMRGIVARDPALVGDSCPEPRDRTVSARGALSRILDAGEERRLAARKNFQIIFKNLKNSLLSGSEWLV